MIDPYHPSTGYRPPDCAADYTLVTHDHFDHNYVAGVRGRTTVLRGAVRRQFDDLVVWGVLGDHDHSDGAELGKTTCFVIEADGLRVVHLGDLCCPFEQPEFGQVDLLLLPVGGGGTCLDARAAWNQIKAVKPRLAIPMHYRTPFTNRVEFPALEGLEPFLSGGKVERNRESSLTLETGEASGATRVVVLSHLCQ